MKSRNDDIHGDEDELFAELDIELNDDDLFEELIIKEIEKWL